MIEAVNICCWLSKTSTSHYSSSETKVGRELLDLSADTGVNYTEGFFYTQVLFGASLPRSLSHTHSLYLTLSHSPSLSCV